MERVQFERFSWHNRRKQAQELSNLATNPDNRDHLDTHVPGLTERYATRRLAAKSIGRVLRHEDKIADIIRVNDRAVGVASYLLGKTVTHPSQPDRPVHGTHVWFWLEQEMYESYEETTEEIAAKVATRSREITQFAEVRPYTYIGDTVVPPDIPPRSEPLRTFTTLTGREDPAWALIHSGFRRLGSPAILTTLPPNDIDGIVIPDTEMVLAVDATRTD